MRRARRRLAALGLAAALVGALALPASAAKDDLDLVSRAAGGPANGDSFQGSLSATGRYVAFASDADNLSGEDGDATTDIFVRDTVTGTTTLVSRASGLGGAAGNTSSVVPSISADGRRVAFHSSAANLSAEDDDSVIDVFVRDLATGATILVSRASGSAGAAGDANSFNASISADGGSVAFQSEADNLSAEDDDAVFDIFVRDLATDTTTLASRASGPVARWATPIPSGPRSR